MSERLLEPEVLDEEIEEPPLSHQALPPAALVAAQPHIQLLEGEHLEAIIDNYIQYYATGENHTARAKRYDLGHFLNFLRRHKLSGERVLVSDWTLQRTKDFVDDRLSQGEAPATVARRLATLKHFGRTLAERVPGFINPAREAKGPVVNLNRPKGLEPEEVSALKQAARELCDEKNGEFAAFRNLFLLELLLATGLRADEVRLLVLGQISDDHKWLRNVKTKAKRFRNVYLDSEIRVLLELYLEKRSAYLQALFPGLTELPREDQARFPVLVAPYRASLSDPRSFGVSPKTIWNAVASIGARAQLIAPERIGGLHPHRLRHAFAHGLLNSSKDIRLVAQALGHSDVRTTMRYTERTEDEIALAIERKFKNE